MRTKKYFEIFKINLMSSASYQLESFNWFIVASISTLLSIILFRTAVSNNAFTNYTEESITLYIVLSLVLNRIMDWYFSWSVHVAVAEGSIATVLIKPYKYQLTPLIEEIAHKVLPTIPYFLILAVFILAFNVKISLSLLNLFYGLISLVLATILRILITYVLSSLSFFIVRTNSVIWFYEWVSAILSGRAFPLDILPKVFLETLKFTPFPYTYFFTISFFIGNIPKNFNFVLFFVTQIFWIILTFFIAKFLWKKGIKKYEIVGN